MNQIDKTNKKHTIAVTGAGGGVGQSIIKALYNSEYNIIALDGEHLATGLYAVPKSFVIPYAKHENYIDSLLQVCKEEKVDLLFPGMDAELKLLAANVDKFKEIGTTVVVSRPEVVEISDNKLLTYKILSEIGVGIPFTADLQGFQMEQAIFPLIVKQKVGGARSKNVFLLRNKTDWENIKQTIIGNESEYIVQEYIEGDEFTCGTVNLNNACKGVIVMKRTLRDGDTYKCFTQKHEVIEESVRKLVEHIKPFGACNIQLRMKDGKPFVFEINARCSGTTAARAICGFNEPLMIANYLIHKIEPTYNIQEKSIFRYWNELVIDNKDIETVKNEKSLTNSNYTPL
jgi:carbamoyl-phosphate synthase large subunit